MSLFMLVKFPLLLKQITKVLLLSFGIWVSRDIIPFYQFIGIPTFCQVFLFGKIIQLGW